MLMLQYAAIQKSGAAMTFKNGLLCSTKLHLLVQMFNILLQSLLSQEENLNKSF